MPVYNVNYMYRLDLVQGTTDIRGSVISKTSLVVFKYKVTYTHEIIVKLYILLGNVGYDRSAVLLWGPKGEHVADLAVDGDPVTCARTSDELPDSTRAWWYVDLGSVHRVTQFILVNKDFTGTRDQSRK